MDTVACGTCHGLAPTAGGHVQTGVKYCSVCHLGVSSSGSLNVDAGTHVNGKADLKADAGHAVGWQPPGHNAAIDFTTCAVCHTLGPQLLELSLTSCAQRAGAHRFKPRAGEPHSRLAWRVPGEAEGPAAGPKFRGLRRPGSALALEASRRAAAAALAQGLPDPPRRC